MVVEELLSKLDIEFDRSAWNGASEVVGRVKEKLAELGKEEGGLSILGFLKAGAIGLGVAAGAAAVGLAAMIGSTARASEETSKAAVRMGITTEKVQELDYAARASGISLEAVEHGMRFLARNAYEATHGSAELSIAFQQAGLSAHRLVAESPDEMLTTVATALEKIPNPAQRTAVAMKLMGRGGTELLPILAKGAEGLEELKKRAHEAGFVMGDEMVKEGLELQESLNTLKLSLLGLVRAISAPFIKPVTIAIKAMEAWVLANRKVITQKIDEFITRFSRALLGLWKILTAVVSLVTGLATNGFVLAGMFALLLPRLFDTAKAVGGDLVSSFQQLVNVIKYFGLEMIAIPLVIALTVAAIVLLLDEMYTFATDGDSYLTDFSGSILHWYDNIVKWVSGVSESFGTVLKYLFDIQKLFIDIGNWWEQSSIRKWLNDHTMRVSIEEMKKNPKFYQVQLSESAFGIGGSPNATAAAAVPANGTNVSGPVGPQINAPQTNNITVNVKSGADPKEIGQATRDAVQEHHNELMREAFENVQGGGRR